MNLDELRTKLSSHELTTMTLRDGTGVLVNLSGMEVLTFNETGMFLCQRVVAGAADVEALAAALVEDFEVDHAVAMTSATGFLRELATALDR